MATTKRIGARLGLALIAAALVLPLAASAEMYREFSGKIDKVGDDKVLVDNRMGDKLVFEKAEDVKVQGDKEEWSALQADDWITVSWKMMDKPRKAYIVKVTPPPEEMSGDGEE